MEEMIGFYKEMGLPCTLEAIGLKKFSEEKLDTAVKHTCRKESYIYNMTVPLDEKKVHDAILMADTLGQCY